MKVKSLLPWLLLNWPLTSASLTASRLIRLSRFDQGKEPFQNGRLLLPHVAHAAPEDRFPLEENDCGELVTAGQKMAQLEECVFQALSSERSNLKAVT